MPLVVLFWILHISHQNDGHNHEMITFWWLTDLQIISKFVVLWRLTRYKEIENEACQVSTVRQFDGPSLKVAAKNVIAEKDVGIKSLIKTK